MLEGVIDHLGFFVKLQDLTNGIDARAPNNVLIIQYCEKRLLKQVVSMNCLVFCSYNTVLQVRVHSIITLVGA